MSFDGVYLYNLAQVHLSPFLCALQFGWNIRIEHRYDCANQFHTIALLKRLRVEFPDVPIKLIWDGAPARRARTMQAAAEILPVRLEPLPAASPDFMPVEHLWHWRQEAVTYHACYDRKADLLAQVERLQCRVNAQPIAIADRLWVKSCLDPDEEKLGSHVRRGLDFKKRKCTSCGERKRN
ncbi:MAG: transposase [Cyanobacteria bacterium J06641_5]